MPLAFGPAPGPRQDALGNPHPSAHQTFTTASIKFKTTRTFPQNLFPIWFVQIQISGEYCFRQLFHPDFGQDDLAWG